MQAQHQAPRPSPGGERLARAAQSAGSRSVRRQRLTLAPISGLAASIRRTVTVPGLPLFELRRRTWDPTPVLMHRTRTRPSEAAAALPEVLAPSSTDVHPLGHGALARLRNATLRMVELKPFGVTGTLGYRLRRRMGWPNPDNDLAPAPQAIVVLQMLVPALAFIAVLWCALSLSRFSDVKRGWELEERATVERIFVAQPMARAASPRSRAGF